MTRPIRIAHLADTHLGYRALHRIDPATGRNQRALDVEAAYTAVVDDILRQEVDLVVHGGDVFHHTRPSWGSLGHFVRQTRRLVEAGLPTVVIAGNHDTPRLRTSGSAFSVLQLALPDVRLVTEYDLEEVPYPDLDLLVTAVPHGALTNPNPPTPYPQADRRNLLLTHGLVPGAIKRRNEPGEEELSGALLDPNFDYVALGHYHVWGAQGHNAWYSGSTERTGWGDLDATPGYVVTTLGAPGETPRVEHRPIATRPMRLLAPVPAEGMEARELADLILGQAAALRLPDAMVRVRVDGAARPTRREVEAIVRREAASVVWSLEVRAPTEGVLTIFGERPTDGAAPDLRALFDAFVEEEVTARHDAAFVAAFRERGGAVLSEAIAAAEAVATTEDGAA